MPLINLRGIFLCFNLRENCLIICQTERSRSPFAPPLCRTSTWLSLTIDNFLL